MEINYNLAEVDYLWFTTKQAFPHLYREALLTSTAKITVCDFKKLFIQRIRRAGLKIQNTEEHVITVNQEFLVWITRNPVQQERQPLTEYLRLKGLVRLGYILRLDEFPEWGCVQISRRHLKKFQTQECVH